MSIKTKIGEAIVSDLPQRGTIAFGSGTTVNAIIEEVGKKLEYFRSVSFVSGSSLTSSTMEKFGVPETINPAAIDICIDGADQVLDKEPRHILKGRGGALFREKVLWKQADRVIVGITVDKLVDRLTMNVPVEVDPFAARLVSRILRESTQEISIRRNPNGFVFYTDNGNIILDCIIPDKDVQTIQQQLKSITGVIETGLFTTIDAPITAYVGEEPDQIEIIEFLR